VFNDELYYWTVMGTPSATEPWGFQFDGHHLVINYFVLGNQVVMSPCFWGTEPTTMKIDGATVTACTEEVRASLAFVRSLSAAQQKTAIISATKADEDMKAGAFADNAIEAYAGIRATATGDLTIRATGRAGHRRGSGGSGRVHGPHGRRHHRRRPDQADFLSWAGGAEGWGGRGVRAAPHLRCGSATAPAAGAGCAGKAAASMRAWVIGRSD
jgi:hypothetical protein